MIEIYPATLGGRQRGGLDNGNVVHAKDNTLNFGDAICGVVPTGKSNGWNASYENITCKKCLSRLKTLNYKIVFDDSMDINF